MKSFGIESIDGRSLTLAGHLLVLISVGVMLGVGLPVAMWLGSLTGYVVVAVVAETKTKKNQFNRRRFLNGESYT